MPASLAVLASVEVEYVTLPGWTEPIAACKVRVFGAWVRWPFVFKWSVADFRGASQERAGLRHVVSCRVKAVLRLRVTACL
jgi:hypothetical protein